MIINESRYEGGGPEPEIKWLWVVIGVLAVLVLIFHKCLWG